MKTRFLGFLSGTLAFAASIHCSPGAGLNLNFNADTFTPNFSVNLNGVNTATNWLWSSSAGVGTPASGGVSALRQADLTATFGLGTFDILSGASTTISLNFKTTTTPGGGGDKPLQIGFLAADDTSFNNTANYSFLSVRVFGDGGLEFQSKTAAGGTVGATLAPAGAVTFNDWLKMSLTLSSINPAAGTYSYQVGVWDLGADGTASPSLLIDPSTHSGSVTVVDFSSTGAGHSAVAGWRSTMGNPNFDNFVISNAVPEPSTLALGVLGLCSVLVLRRRRG